MPSTTPVRDVMTTKVVTMTPDQTFETAADVLAEHKIGAVPVIDADVTHMPVIDPDGNLVGIIARGDIVRHLAQTT